MNSKYKKEMFLNALNRIVMYDKALYDEIEAAFLDIYKEEEE